MINSIMTAGVDFMLMNDNQYLGVVKEIKERIEQARHSVVLSANKELILMYYEIGKIINFHKSWGNKFIDNLAKDIKLAYPDSTGYSSRNLKYMAKFAAEYTDEQIVQTLSAQLTWSHNIDIMDKVKDMDERKWYMLKAIENGWSHNVLVHQIESKLYERQAVGTKVTNFDKLLPAPQKQLMFCSYDYF